MISPEKIAEIRNRASIVEVVSDYVSLKKTGRNYLGLCPFHSEKTPSFTVSEEKGIYHCFGCQTGGSVFHFMMQHDQLTFPEAIERIAKRYGITIPRDEKRGAYQDSGERERLYRINERAAANYHKILFDRAEGKKALDYLKARGVDEATAQKFTLGYAPQGGSGLLTAIQKGSLSADDAIRLGLIGQRAPGQHHEKFFARVIFPILNPAGKVVAFGGRVLDEGLPKYLNSSETPLFHKGSTLYGLYQAKEAIRKADRVVVVEGYLDVIALAQHDVGYTVATLGTALTADHVRALSRYTRNIIALFDGDQAGQKAAARSFEIFVEAGLLGRAAFLPKEDDPDTFVRSHGKVALEVILDQAVPLADFYFSWLQSRHGQSLEGKSQIANEISRVLAKVKNPFEVDLIVARAVDRLGIREEVLRRHTAVPGARMAVGNQSPLSPSMGREDRAERMLVSLMLRLPEIIDRVANGDEERRGFSPVWRPVVDGIVAEWQKHGNIEVSRLTQTLPLELSSVIAALALEGDDFSDATCVQMAADCLTRLKRKYIRSQRLDKRLSIRVAGEKGDDQAEREGMLAWHDLAQEERQLERPKLEPKRPVR
jgi:DNA primase